MLAVIFPKMSLAKYSQLRDIGTFDRTLLYIIASSRETRKEI